VRRLRKHPSLVFWCGNNENSTMFESKWGDPTRHPPRCYGERIYEQVLPEVLAELDHERPYLPTSPWGGALSNDGGIGDQHYWDVWHGRGDWLHYRDSTARFASEFGFAAAPGPRALERILGPGQAPRETDVRDARVRFHDKTLKGYETFLSYVALHYPEPANLEEWAYYSQLNQRDALRFGIEHYRRSEFCKGSLIWQLNDCWPVLSWAVIDSEGAYKAAAYELRRLYAPALVSIQREALRLSIWGVLDNVDAARSGELLVEVHDLSVGSVLHSQRARIQLAPGERRQLIDLDVSAWSETSTLVTASFCGNATFQLLCEPKSLKLTSARLTATLSGALLTIESTAPVVDLYLWDATGAAQLLDNFVTLPGAGTKVLRVRGTPGELRARSLAGLHEIALSAP
jgi:beta-mannosidase